MEGSKNFSKYLIKCFPREDVENINRGVNHFSYFGGSVHETKAISGEGGLVKFHSDLVHPGPLDVYDTYP